MIFKRFSHRWASQLLALPAAILLLAAFSLAQTEPPPDPEEPVEEIEVCPNECQEGTFCCDNPELTEGGFDPGQICCPDGQICLTLIVRDEDLNPVGATNGCAAQP